MMGEIVNHLWQSTVFAILAVLLALAFRKHRAQVRYWIWFCASVKFLVPFALLLTLGGYLGRSPAAKSVPVPAITSTVVEVAMPFPVTPLPTPSPGQNVDWIPRTLISLWLCGALGIVLLRARAWVRIRAAVRNSKPLQITFPVPVRSSPHTLEPGLVGIFRPVLLLPGAILGHLAPKQMESILAHELCHVRRRDNLTAGVHMVVETLFWFHPLVWWISARLMEERERACDESVLEAGSEPRAYADGILKTCEFCVESTLACVSGVTGSDLEKRIFRIMTHERAEKLKYGGKLLLAGFGCATVLAPLLLGLKAGPRVWAQNSQPGGAHPPAFEVASIKPYPGCESKRLFGGTFTPSPDRVEIPCTDLKSLIEIAYGTFRDGVSVDPQRLRMEGGPSWMQAEFYSVSAKAEAPPAHPQMMLGPMLQALLEERFQLKTHREMRETPVYAMTVGKGGLKVQPVAQVACTPTDAMQLAEGKPGEPPCGVPLIRPTGASDLTLEMLGSTMKQFAQELSRFSGRTVVDETATSGRFNFQLEFMPDPAIAGHYLPGARSGDAGNPPDLGNPLPAPEGGPDLFSALQKQIGLKLTPAKGSLSVLIIDHVEKPGAN